MPKIRDRKFKKTARPLVRMRTDRPHSWKHHFRGVFAEVIGYLELLAKNDPLCEMFTWVQVEDIVKHCNRYHKGKRYSHAAVCLALEYFRAQHIVSGVVERRRFNQTGEPYTFAGRIVTPHYVFCKPDDRGRFCVFDPYRKTPGHKWAGQKQKLATGSATGAPVIWWAGPVKKRG